MIQNLDVFLWNRKVGTLVAYKEKYVDKVISVVSNYQRYEHIAGVDAYCFVTLLFFDCNFFYFLDHIRSMAESIILTISLRLMQAKETLHK